MALIRHLAVFLLLSATTIWASPGNAQGWQRLDDGRVVIEVFGEKLAFFPEDGRIVRFWKGQTEELFNLETAIADPPKAQRRLFELGQNDWVRVVVDNDVYWKQQQQGRKFLGRFDWSEIPTLGPPHRLVFSIARPQENGPGHKPYLPLPNKYFPKAIGPSALGFTAYLPDGFESVQSRIPRVVRYALPGHQRTEPSKAPLVVICKWTGASSRRCISHLLSNDRRVRVLWQWYENQFPEASWRQLDERLREITDFIVVGRGREDFE